MTSYGNVLQSKVSNRIDESLEELEINGFTIIDSGLSKKELSEAISISNKLNALQEKNLSKAYLKKINELNMVRAPLVHDEFFLKKVALNPNLSKLIERVLGKTYQLHLQNIIINTPKEQHHQRSWHRDLPYQNYVVSKPISISSMFCLTDFNQKNGGTELIPYSHKLELMPSQNYVDKHLIQPELKAGQIMVFNSFLFHRAGFNKTTQKRIGINNIFTTPIIKQQINLPEFLEGKYKKQKKASMLLGYDFPTINSDEEFRELRLKKISK